MNAPPTADALERAAPADSPALRYLQVMDRVHGWLLPVAARCILCLHQTQQHDGVRGSIAEIGVHHGKLFILLCLLRNDGEIAVGYDLFDRQAENVDKSGKGSLDRLNDNLRLMNVSTRHLKLITANSRELTSDIVLRESEGPVRLFSIDGGHTAEITSNDLSIAAGAISQHGVIILDDFFNEAWPGVATGTFQFMRDHPETIIPFAALGNKVFFAKTARAADTFRNALLHSKTLSEHLRSGVSEFLGHPVFIGYDPRLAVRVGPGIELFLKRISLLKSPRILAQRIKGKVRVRWIHS